MTSVSLLVLLVVTAVDAAGNEASATVSVMVANAPTSGTVPVPAG